MLRIPPLPLTLLPLTLCWPVLLPAASSRSQNFIVYARDGRLAETVARQAEQLRQQLAMQWLGRELPPWRDKCPIRVQARPNLPAGGETSFVFQGREPGKWHMKIWGSRQRVLDSVLPHEITHTVFATHFGQPLPRWADEGACTTVEAASERRKHEYNLIQFLQTDQGIPFARMFVMKQYPRNLLPLYAQGYSVARFLVAQRGKRRFVQFLDSGLQSGRWSTEVRRFYHYKDLSDLQLHWNRWVAKGSPPLPRQPTTGKPLTKKPLTKKPLKLSSQSSNNNFYLRAAAEVRKKR